MKKCLFKDCQKEFEPNKPKQKFCSAKCRVYFSRSLKPKKMKLKNFYEVIKNTSKETKQEVKEILDGLDIKNQIEVIMAEKIPKERDTSFGRKSWQHDQQKRIETLQSQLK